jgi:hypothetical protein
LAVWLAVQRYRYCSGAGAPRHDQRRGFYVDTVVDSRYLEMDVVREREEVEMEVK